MEEIEMLSDDKSNLVRGYADNCFTLYLYERPSDDSNVVGHVDRLTELVIDTLESTDEWCNVTTPTGREGYAKASKVHFYKR